MQVLSYRWHATTKPSACYRSPSATFHSNQAAIRAFRVTEGPSLCAGPTRPSTPPRSQGIAGLSAVLADGAGSLLPSCTSCRLVLLPPCHPYRAGSPRAPVSPGVSPSSARRSISGCLWPAVFSCWNSPSRSTGLASRFHAS